MICHTNIPEVCKEISKQIIFGKFDISRVKVSCIALNSTIVSNKKSNYRNGNEVNLEPHNDGIIAQESNPPIYQAFLSPVRAF